MKVIVAGMPKTGTKSMTAALKLLGYEVYDFVEHMYYLEHEWVDVFKNGWQEDTFYKMYKDIDAAVDMPASCFWEELHKAFPDAKVILTMRDSEDVWFESLKNHFTLLDNHILARIVQIIELVLQRGTGMLLTRSYQYFLDINRAVLGRRTNFNESILKKKYRAHNAHVSQTIPSDRLLVFNAKQGWEPLCKFLGVEAPSRPFPHENIRAAVIEDTVNHPVGKVYQKEVILSCAWFSIKLILFIVLCIYAFKFFW